MAKYRTGTPDEWHPPLRSSGRKPDELDEQMSVLEEGNLLIIEAEDEKELRGKRLALGRRAKARGFAVDQYTQGLTIYARKRDEDAPATPPSTEEPSEPAEPATRRRRGRRKATDAEADAPE